MPLSARTRVASESVPIASTPGCPACRLRSACFVDLLDPVALGGLVGLVRRREPSQKDTVICRQGDALEAFFALRSGSAKAWVDGEDGSETVTDFFLPGDLIGAAALSDRRFPFSVVLLERSAVCELPLAAVHDLMAVHRQFRERFVALLGAEIRKGIERQRWERAPAEARVATFIDSMRRSLARIGRREDDLTLTMSRNDIASFLGIASETVSRILTSFERLGIIEVRGRALRILDAGTLHAKAGSLE